MEEISIKEPKEESVGKKLGEKEKSLEKEKGREEEIIMQKEEIDKIEIFNQCQRRSSEERS